LGGYVKMAGEMPTDESTGAKWEFMSKPVSARALIIFAGPALNYILAFLVFITVFMLGNPQLTSTIGSTLEDYPAVQAGLKSGDRVIEIDGKPIEYWEDILDAIHKKTEGRLQVKVLRGRRELNYKITPEVKHAKNVFGQDIKLALIGISPSEEIEFVKYAPLQSVYLSANRVWGLTRVTYIGLWRIVTGGISFKESVAGPIGIYIITAQAARLGLVYVLQILAMISVCLAIFNLLPIPVLDGGHLLFLAIEKIRRKPLSPKLYEKITNVGLFFLILLMVFVFFNDLDRKGVFKKAGILWQQGAERLKKF